MTDVSHEQRWGVYLVQAQNFARRENYLDAVSRANLVASEVEAALSSESDQAIRERLSAMLLRARKLREQLQAELDAWNGTIAARRARVIAGADAEMKRPLPNPPPALRR